MALSQEIIEELGLQEEQVTKISSFYDTNVIPTLKKNWDGKANTDAEGILTGASKYASEKFGIELEREQGEKWGDYLARISENALETKTNEISKKEEELQKKLENFKGSAELKEKYEKALADLDTYKQTVAELEPLRGLDEKYKQTSERLTNMQKEVAYGSVKPNFPDTVNKYEADAKWNEWKNGIEAENHIELIDNVPYAINKENEHKKVKLSELLESDANIKELLQGRNQRGNNARSVDLSKVEGIPFEVPKGLDSKGRAVLIREHLAKEGISAFHRDYEAKFSELNKKLLSVK